MCTSFVFRKENVMVGMNFDNDGKRYKIHARPGKSFQVMVEVNKTFFPSLGISGSGIFVNDQMVDSTGVGKYKRQNDKRWVTTSLIRHILESDIGFDEIFDLLESVEIVNAPNSSTHNLVVDRMGNTCVVEPGRRNISSGPQDSGWYALTNFPLSDYKEVVPGDVSGSGTDRYLKICQEMAATGSVMSVEKGFGILKGVSQNNLTWRTELSMIYDCTQRELYYCVEQNFEEIYKHALHS